MSSNTAKYRLENPEYREKEREKDRITSNQKYKEDEAYRQKKRERALAFYYKKKEQQQNQAISAI
jgi:hypothetical protein